MADGIFEHVAGRVQHHVDSYFHTVLNATLVSVVRVTIPGTISKSPTGVKKPTKEDVRVLAKRIHGNILGTGVLPSAVPNAAGRPVRIEWEAGSPNNLAMVVPRGQVKGVRVLRSEAEVLEHLKANTVFRRPKGGTAKLRVKKKGARTAFVSASAWRAAARRLQARAGNFVAGWQAAGQAAGSTAVERTVQARGEYSYRGSVTKATKSELEAENLAAPSADLRRYQKKVLRPRMASETRYFSQRFLKFMVRAIKKEMRGGMVK